jgi:hypothetical protein
MKPTRMTQAIIFFLLVMAASQLCAQSIAQDSYVKIADSGFQYAASGKKRVYLRVTYDLINHSDGSSTYSV